MQKGFAGRDISDEVPGYAFAGIFFRSRAAFESETLSVPGRKKRAKPRAFFISALSFSEPFVSLAF
jgi:hypothetical protein